MAERDNKQEQIKRLAVKLTPHAVKGATLGGTEDTKKGKDILGMAVEELGGDESCNTS